MSRSPPSFIYDFSPLLPFPTFVLCNPSGQASALKPASVVSVLISTFGLSEKFKTLSADVYHEERQVDCLRAPAERFPITANSEEGRLAAVRHCEVPPPPQAIPPNFHGLNFVPSAEVESRTATRRV